MLITKSSGPLEAFAAAAGISASELSLLIRTSILVGFFIWATWCVLNVMSYYKAHPSESIVNLLKDYARISFLISVVIALVFIA